MSGSGHRRVPGAPGVDPPSGAHDPSLVLDPLADPGAAALGATGAEATVDMSWLTLIHRRVQRRATKSPHYKWWVLGGLLAGLFSLNVTFTVFVVALPTVAKELHTSISVLTWTTTGPLLAFGLAAPLFGRTGDLFGHRRVYLWGMAGAVLCAVLTATAPNAAVLVTARVLDGIEGAATGTASMALILQVFPSEERVKALGWWTLVGAGGPVLGVTIGAPIIQLLGWRALFWGQLICLALSALVVILVLPGHRRHATAAEGPGLVPSSPADPTDGPPGGDHAGSRWDGIDWLGSWSLSFAVTFALLALNIAPTAGWGSPWVVLFWVAAACSLGSFVLRELRATHPLIPTHYFSRRNFVFPIGARSCLAFAYFGGFFLFPLLMEQVYGYQVAQVGLISIARPLVFSLSSPVAGYVAVKVGERSTAVAGALAVLGSMVLFAALRPDSSLPIIVVALCLSGLGMGVASPSTTSSMANEFSSTDLGIMSATGLLATQVGEVAGIQVLQTILESHAKSLGLDAVHRDPALLTAFRAAFVVGALVALAGVACSFMIRRADRRPDTVSAGAPQPVGGEPAPA